MSGADPDAAEPRPVSIARGAGLSAPQRAGASVRLGERFGATAEVAMTPGGLLAVGAMVTAILLGSAAIVRAARRPYRRGA